MLCSLRKRLAAVPMDFQQFRGEVLPFTSIDPPQ
jgi:hypothetical protein